MNDIFLLAVCFRALVKVSFMYLQTNDITYPFGIIIGSLEVHSLFNGVSMFVHNKRIQVLQALTRSITSMVSTAAVTLRVALFLGGMVE